MIETKNTELEKKIKDAFNLLVKEYGWDIFCAADAEIIFSDKFNIHYENNVYTVQSNTLLRQRFDGKVDITGTYSKESTGHTLIRAFCDSLPVPRETYFRIMESFAADALKNALNKSPFLSSRHGTRTYMIGIDALERCETPSSLASVLEKVKEDRIWGFRTLVQDYFNECEERV